MYMSVHKLYLLGHSVLMTSTPTCWKATPIILEISYLNAPRPQKYWIYKIDKSIINKSCDIPSVLCILTVALEWYFLISNVTNLNIMWKYFNTLNQDWLTVFSLPECKTVRPGSRKQKSPNIKARKQKAQKPLLYKNKVINPFCSRKIGLFLALFSSFYFAWTRLKH